MGRFEPKPSKATLYDMDFGFLGHLDIDVLYFYHPAEPSSRDCAGESEDFEIISISCEGVDIAAMLGKDAEEIIVKLVKESW